MSTTNEKDLTYEEAKELCRKAFDGGVTYGTESMRYGVNAVAYDWEHWLKDNEHLFTPPPTIESTLREFALEIDPSADIAVTGAETIKKFAAKLQLRSEQ